MAERPTFGNLVQRIKNESFYFYIGESNLVQKIKNDSFYFHRRENYHKRNNKYLKIM